MRIVAIGDIGVVDDVIHIGDEAMFEALVDALRARGVEHVTGLSAQPGESALRYGIDAVQSIGFPPERPASEDRMRRILATVGGESGLLADDDPAHAVIAAVRDADGVVIAGGGNMTSLWPHHIFERATLGAVARALGKPLVVSGQTIGPELGQDDRALVTDLLSSAQLVGVREASSFALVGSLGVTAEHTIDDASYLVSAPPTTGEYTLVSLAGHVASADKDAVVTAVAEFLDVVAKRTGLDTVFLPHFASLHSEQRVGDSLMHDRVIAAMTSPARLVTPTDSVDAARLAREASLVVSSRYHPVVFAVPAGVPAIGIPVDEYTGVKLRGALANFGQDGVLPVDDLLEGKGAEVAAAVWDRRAIIRADAARLSVEKHAASVAWWDRVVEALRPAGA